MSDTETGGITSVQNNNTLKIIFVIIFFVYALLCGLFPTCNKGCRESPKILGIANSFAGGVFLAIALVHILPESVEGYGELKGEDSFPLPYLLIFIGYSLILLLDKVMFDTHSLFEEDHELQMILDSDHIADPAALNFQAEAKRSIIMQVQTEKNADDSTQVRQSLAQVEQDINQGMKTYLNQYNRFATRLRASMSKDNNQELKASLVDNQKENSQEEIIQEQQDYFVNKENINLKAQQETQQPEYVSINKEGQQQTKDVEMGSINQNKEQKDGQTKLSQINEVEPTIIQKKSCCPNLTPYVLMIALSVHSIFEGLALGLDDTRANVVNLILGIAIHKGAAGCSLGISLVKTFPNDFKIVRICILIFAAATPVGIIIGMLLQQLPEIYNIIFSSLAAGTFVYIACSEVIVEEFAVPGNRWLKYFVFLLGSALIVILWFLE